MCDRHSQISTIQQVIRERNQHHSNLILISMQHQYKLVGDSTNPFETYARQNGFIFPFSRGEHKTYLSCHHPVNLVKFLHLQYKYLTPGPCNWTASVGGMVIRGICGAFSATLPNYLDLSLKRGSYMQCSMSCQETYSEWQYLHDVPFVKLSVVKEHL